MTFTCQEGKSELSWLACLKTGSKKDQKGEFSVSRLLASQGRDQPLTRLKWLRKYFGLLPYERHEYINQHMEKYAENFTICSQTLNDPQKQPAGRKGSNVKTRVTSRGLITLHLAVTKPAFCPSKKKWFHPILHILIIRPLRQVSHYTI